MSWEPYSTPSDVEPLPFNYGLEAVSLKSRCNFSLDCIDITLDTSEMRVDMAISPDAAISLVGQLLNCLGNLARSRDAGERDAPPFLSGQF